MGNCAVCPHHLRTSCQAPWKVLAGFSMVTDWMCVTHVIKCRQAGKLGFRTNQPRSLCHEWIETVMCRDMNLQLVSFSFLTAIWRVICGYLYASRSLCSSKLVCLIYKTGLCLSYKDTCGQSLPATTVERSLKSIHVSRILQNNQNKASRFTADDILVSQSQTVFISAHWLTAKWAKLCSAAEGYMSQQRKIGKCSCWWTGNPDVSIQLTTPGTGPFRARRICKHLTNTNIYACATQCMTSSICSALMMEIWR